ncbi:MAG: MinD/ParA family protein [Acidaminobacteraceae bacterium]
MDQAQKLREIVKSDVSKETSGPQLTMDSRIITISSGKGGVGKTNFTVNLAIALAKLGNKVTIIDADLGLANVDVILGIVPKYTLSNVIRNEKEIDDIIVEGPNGIKIISGGSGVRDLVDLNEDEINSLIESFNKLNLESDYILIDTGAGISNSVLSFINAANDIILVVTPDPTSITDAYAVIKNIVTVEKNIKVVVNRVESNSEGLEVFNKINKASMKFLDKELDNIGYIYEDSSVKKSVKIQKPFILNAPNSLASKGVDLIAYNIENNNKFIATTNGFSRFINRLMNNM